jgi:hypothetical protein
LAVVMLLIVIAIPAGAFLLLQSKTIQTNVAGKVMEIVSEKLGTQFTIGGIDVAFLYRIRLNDVYLEDLSGDTLIHANSITAGIQYINPIKYKVSIGSINLDKAMIALALDSTSELNLKLIIDKLKGDGKVKKNGWEVVFNNIRMQNSRFSLKNFFYEPQDYGINFTDLDIYDLNADIRKFNPTKDSLSFLVKSLNFKEKSGFTLDNMTTRFSQSKTFLSFRNLKIKTAGSDIHGEEISLRFDSYDQFKADSLISSVRFRINLRNTLVDLSDIGYFAPLFRDNNQKVAFTGLVTGPVNNFRGKNLEIEFGNTSRLVGNLKFEGLPDINQTFILADVEEFTTSAADIRRFQLPGNRKISLPEILNKLGIITYKGNFTGFVNDFVAYGTFNTALGTLQTDLLFRPDTSNSLGFQGKLNAQEFDIGTLANASESLGNISLSATIDGATIEGGSVNASLKGLIKQLQFKDYEYTNISLSGYLMNKTFNGSVSVHDPNVDLEFLGKVNLSDTIPAFDFTANITDANLYALNLNKTDPDFRVSCFIIANAVGNSINSLNGEIKLLNSLFVKKDQQLQLYDLSLLSENRAGYNHLQLRSDFLDADLSGNFELSKSGKTLSQFIHMYLPSLLDTSYTSNEPIRNSIAFESVVKNSKPLFDFFLPGYGISEKSTINLTYSPQDNQMHFNLQARQVTVDNLVWNGINVNAIGNDELLQFEVGCRNFVLANRIHLENFTALVNAAEDTAGVRLRWNNWEDLQYRGNIAALAKVTRKEGSNTPFIEIGLKSSDFVTNDTVWAIQPGKISIDSSSIQFNNLAINHKNESFRINGNISENESDILSVVFNRFNLANLNGLTAVSGYDIGGVLNGSAKVSGLYSNPLFTSTLKIDSLMINSEMLGSTEINSSWDDSRKAILLNAFALRDDLKTINIKGEYQPADKGKLDFSLQLEKLRLNIFNPYLKSIFSDIRGIASGKATLSGTLEKPLLNGQFNLMKTTLTVNYLQTRYNFSDKVVIENNNIYFEDIRIFDSRGNSAYLNGAIRNRFFKDLTLDLNIKPENFMALNTTLADNKQFYGTAYATGLIKITGPVKNIFIDVTATTDPNTSIKIPLSNSGELNEYPYVTVNMPGEEDEESDEEIKYTADLSGVQIRFKLMVTPDAEVQIIFDPKLGEIIRGRGTGNLDIRVNPSGDFVMSGDYIIEKGDYLFTLQKVINKKLTIEPGGTIKWSGDPLDATVDIVAYYRVNRAAISDLTGNTADDQKVMVDDRVTMTGRLMAPDIKYDIYLPEADEATRLKVNGSMTSSEEKSRQFISLLINQTFSLNQEMSSSNSSSYSGAAGANFSELLSNQLSNMLSQIINDLDVDVNYKPNREMNSDEVQVALSYQLFNDKLTINGSVDMATNATRDDANEIVGEFDIDYKLTKNGKLRVKTFQHANNDVMLEDNSTYTQGLGISYKEDFNTFGELMRRLFGKKEESPEPVTEKKSDPVLPDEQ